MNKKVSKILIYMFTILSIPFFAYYPTSNAKYIKEEKNPLVYNVNLKRMYFGQVETIRTQSNYLKANYQVEFNRSDLMTENDNKQLIKIVVDQPKCNITSVTSSASKSINKNEAVLTYNTSSTNGEKITVKYNCNVNEIIKDIDGVNFVYSSIKMYEKNVEETDYHLYAYSFNSLSEEAYYKLYPIPTSEISPDSKTLIMPNNITDKYKEVFNWIKLYSSVYNIDPARTEAYFKTVFNNSDDVINPNNFNALKGLNISYDSSTQKYTYVIDDNFEGYLKTYYSFTESSNYYVYYFSNSNMSDQEFNEALKNYLNMYKLYTEYTDEQIQLILNYINAYGTVKQIINKEVTVPGITAYDNSYIRFNQNIIDYAESYFDPRIKLKFNTSASMWITFTGSIQTKYSFVSNELNSTLTNDTNLLYSIIKNNTSTTPVAYSDYYKYYDEANKNYVILNVESSGAYSEENPTGGNTYVELVELGNASDLTLITKQETETPLVNELIGAEVTFDKEDTTIDPKEELIETVEALDTYLETKDNTEDITDELFTETTELEDTIFESEVNEEEIIINLDYTKELDNSGI